jgi:hypothetical protein
MKLYHGPMRSNFRWRRQAGKWHPAGTSLLLPVHTGARSGSTRIHFITRESKAEEAGTALSDLAGGSRFECTAQSFPHLASAKAHLAPIAALDLYERRQSLSPTQPVYRSQSPIGQSAMGQDRPTSLGGAQ